MDEQNLTPLNLQFEGTDENFANLKNHGMFIPNQDWVNHVNGKSKKLINASDKSSKRVL
jgi:hypothetical protein